MTGGTRIAIFAAILVAVFAGAFTLGGAFGGEQEHGGGVGEHSAEQAGATTPVVTEEHGGHGEEIGGSHGEGARDPAATDTHDLRLELATPEGLPKPTATLAFEILGPGGEPVRKFEVEHTKQLHLIVVRKDLTNFQHVHPTVGDDGTWSADIRADLPGDYRVIADVRHDGSKIALTADLDIPGDRTSPAPVEDAPGYEAAFRPESARAGEDLTLEFDVERAGRAIVTEPYLGAAGHLVALHEKDLEYIHVHPEDDELSFAANFPKPGNYALFLEFRHRGAVHHKRLWEAVK